MNVPPSSLLSNFDIIVVMICRDHTISQYVFLLGCMYARLKKKAVFTNEVQKHTFTLNCYYSVFSGTCHYLPKPFLKTHSLKTLAKISVSRVSTLPRMANTTLLKLNSYLSNSSLNSCAVPTGGPRKHPQPNAPSTRFVCPLV